MKQKRQPNIMEVQILLVYIVISIMFCPIIFCLRHHEMPNNSTLSQVTTSPNSINVDSTVFDMSDVEMDDEEGSEEDSSSYNSENVQIEYERQYRKFNKYHTKNEDRNFGVTTTTTPKTTEDSCSSMSCRDRQSIEKANTESIRKNILMKLGMEQEPNRTVYPKLPDEVREILCKRINISPDKCLGKEPVNVEYQSDDPLGQYDYNEQANSATREDEEEVQFLSYENRIYAFPSREFKLHF